MQYTLRSIPNQVDAALRRRARRERKSLNQVAIEALATALGTGEERIRHRDLAGIAGAWVEDAQTDKALAAARRIDRALWR
jgi:plasmid stability protein